MRIIHHLAVQADGSHASQSTSKTAMAIDDVRLNLFDNSADGTHHLPNLQWRESLLQVHLVHPIHHILITLFIVVLRTNKELPQPSFFQTRQEHLEIAFYATCALCNMQDFHHKPKIKRFHLSDSSLH